MGDVTKAVADDAKAKKAIEAKEKKEAADTKKQKAEEDKAAKLKAAADKKKEGEEAKKKKEEEAAAKKKAATEAKAKKTLRIQPDEVITLLVNENPKREGSEAHQRFALYKNGMTVEDFLKAGGNMVDINWDLGHRLISVAKKSQHAAH